jgi:hypothetical protein
LSKDTEEQKREFEDHPEKLLAYRKAIEADLNGGFESVCYSIIQKSCGTFANGVTPAQALFDSPQQALARENLTRMMRARLGEENALADRIIPSFGVGCR